MKLVIGQVAHETNTFSTIHTTKELFQKWEWDHGDAVLVRHKGVEDYLGGMIERGEELEVETIPSFSAYANPSGMITKNALEELKSNLIESICSIEEYDGVCLMLHGAGVAENTDDLEGYILQELRQVVGYEVPLVVVLDLHANVSDLMVQEADLLIGDNHYPHIDSFERGKEAIDLSVKLVKNEIQPEMHLETLPLIIPTFSTALSPAKEINDRCWKWEEAKDVIDCTFYHGFSYADTAHTGVSILTITHQSKPLAEQVSKDVAEFIWNEREGFNVKYPSPLEGLNLPIQEQSTPIVINETSDNPGAGTPGDGTYLLKALMDKEVKEVCFAAIYDPEVAEVAHKAGPGSSINVKLGGKSDQLHGEPVEINGYVKSITDGCFEQTSPMWRGIQVDLGKSVRLRVKGIDIIVCSVNNQVMDDQLFKLHGIDPVQYRFVAIKSSIHFRAFYELLSSTIITVDSPGLSTSDLTSFDYKNILKPIAPLNLVER